MKKQIFLLSLLSLSLFSCNSTVYHTIKFVGTDCYMTDEAGTKINEAQFEAGQAAFCYLLPNNDNFNNPLTDDVKVTYTKTGEEYVGSFFYNPSNGALAVKMTDDITITACSISNTIVTETEFNKAISLSGVTYLQIEIIDNETEGTKNSRFNQYSPNIFYTKQISQIIDQDDTFLEEYYYKTKDNDIRKLSRDNPNTPWGDWQEMQGLMVWPTPESLGEGLNNMLETRGIAFDSTKYDSSSFSYVFVDNMGISNSFKFKNKKLISIERGQNLYQFTFEYQEKAPDLPIPAPTLAF